MKLLRVLHIVPAVFDAELGILGGAERYATELARNMAEVTPTTLVAFGPRDAEWKLGRLEIRVIADLHHDRRVRVNPTMLELIPEIARHDVIHVHQKHRLVSSFTALAGRVMRRPVFVTDHGGGAWDFSAYFSTDRWYTAEMHVSQYSRRIARQIENPRSRVIYGGIDVSRFCPSPSPSTKNRDAPVVFVGRLLPHKGINDLVVAAARDINLDLIGRPHDARFLADLHRMAAGPNVRFIHDAQDRDLVEAYRSSLCVVLPSVYRDCYGNETVVPELLGQTLLEGMACGVPGVATNVASLPEVVEDGVSGFIVPPNDPNALGIRLRWLRDHPDQAAKLGRAARQRVLERFVWPAVVLSCMNAYRSDLAVRSA